jgi:integrase
MLTDIAIKKLLADPPSKEKTYRDGKVLGLFLKVRPSGAASWFLLPRIDGVQKKLTLGSYPVLGAMEARRKATEARGKVAAGQDPAGEKQAARRAAKAEREAEGDLIEKVVETFIERHAKAHTRDWRETKRLLEKNAVERWKGRRLSTITRAQAHDLYDAMADRGAAISANRLHTQLNVMSAWAVERGIIEKNPFEGIKAPTSEKGRQRDRVLTDDELRLVWSAAEAVAWPFGPAVKLLMLTGQRRDEVAQMEWREVDLARATWTLPALRSKNRREHTVPLSDEALTILKSLPRTADRDGYVFTTTNGRVPVSGFNRAKIQIDAAIAELRVAGPGSSDQEPWVFHDLRRTCATNLQRLGVRLEVTEAVLNHLSGSRAGVVGIYQRHDWATEKRQALDAWARRLEGIVSGAATSNVVELAKARG